MQITFKEIIEWIDDLLPQYICLDNPGVPVDSILPSSSTDNSFTPNAMYIGLSSDLPSVCPPNFLCIEDTPLPEAYTRQQRVNLTVLPKGTEIRNLYGRICTLLFEHNNALVATANLLKALAKARDLKTLVAIIYKAIGNPIIVNDKSWKALAIASDLKKTDDTAWNEFLTKGVLSLKTISVNIKEKLAEKIEQSERPFLCQKSDMKYPRLFCRITVGTRAVATVSVIEYNKPFTKRDHFLVYMLANAISVIMQNNDSFRYNRGLKYEEILMDLIEGRLKNPNAIEEKITSYSLGLRKIIQVITIDVKYFSIPDMRDRLENIVRGSKTIICNDKITMITSYDKEDEIFEYDAVYLRDMLKEFNLHAGISRSFTELEKMRDHYLQSLEALEIGTHLDSDQTLYAYEDYAIYHIAKVCANSEIINRFCHPKLEFIMKYDAEHKTAFTYSLYIYLKNSRNITNAAKELHLHRNSMIYHIKRIEEILGFDLSDNEKLLQIELSFRLMEYDKKINKSFFAQP